MDDLVISLAREVKEELDKLPEIQEYLKLKKLYETDPTLIELRQNIARLESEGKKEEKNNLIEIYNSNPLVVNYLQTKEEVINILDEIKKQLSD